MPEMRLDPLQKNAEKQRLPIVAGMRRDADARAPRQRAARHPGLADRAPSRAGRCRHARENASATVRRCHGRRASARCAAPASARRRRRHSGRRAAAPRIPPSGRDTRPRRDTIRASRIRGGASRRARRCERHARAARCGHAAGQQLLHREFGRGVQIARSAPAPSRGSCSTVAKACRCGSSPGLTCNAGVSTSTYPAVGEEVAHRAACMRPRAARACAPRRRTGRDATIRCHRPAPFAYLRRRNPLCPVFPGW